MDIMKPKPYCETIGPWLKANLGHGCLAPLTGTDRRALHAAVMIVDLWSETRSFETAEAFRTVVREMQHKCWPLAYHAIAHVCDWSHRDELWKQAGLVELAHPGRCVGEGLTAA